MITETYISTLDQDQIKKDAKAIIVALRTFIVRIGFEHFLALKGDSSYVEIAVKKLGVPNEIKKKYSNLYLRLFTYKEKTQGYLSGSYSHPSGKSTYFKKYPEYINLLEILPPMTNVSVRVANTWSGSSQRAKRKVQDAFKHLLDTVKDAHSSLTHELTHYAQFHKGKFSSDYKYINPSVLGFTNFTRYSQYFNQPIERDAWINEIISIIDRAISKEKDSKILARLPGMSVEEALVFAKKHFPNELILDYPTNGIMSKKNVRRLEIAYYQMLKRLHRLQ